MYKIDKDPDLLFGNVQIQPCKLEPLESGKDSVNINLSGLDSSSEQDGIMISTTKESTATQVWNMLPDDIRTSQSLTAYCSISYCFLHW